MAETLLLTGATGHVGTALLPELLEDPDLRVLALVRARDEEHLAHRLETLRQRLDPSVRSRVDAVAGDVTAPGLGLRWADRDRVAEEVESILHSAASVRFDMDEATARAKNIGSSKEVVALATSLHRRGRLKRLDHVSTCYVAGDRVGRVHERECDVGQGFRNNYEWSKCQSEKVVHAAVQEGLPAAVHRPSIVVGDSRTGKTESFNVLYWPLKLWARGWWRTFPGRADCLVDVVPVDFVAGAIARLRRTDASLGGTFHLAAGDEAPTVEALIDHVSARVSGPRIRYVDQGRYRRFVRPVIRPVLVRTRRGRQIMRGGDVYLPYFVANPLFDTTQARALLGDLRPPPVLDYIDRVVRFAMDRDFGER